MVLHDAWVVGPSLIYLVGDYGTVLRWNGSTLTRMPTPTTATLRKIWFESPVQAWVLGDGVVLRLVSGAWTTALTNLGFRDVRGFGTGQVMLLGSGANSSRIWNGSTFSVVPSTPANTEAALHAPDGVALNAVFFNGSTAPATSLVATYLPGTQSWMTASFIQPVRLASMHGSASALFSAGSGLARGTTGGGFSTVPQSVDSLFVREPGGAVELFLGGRRLFQGDGGPGWVNVPAGELAVRWVRGVPTDLPWIGQGAGMSRVIDAPGGRQTQPVFGRYTFLDTDGGLSAFTHVVERNPGERFFIGGVGPGAGPTWRASASGAVRLVGTIADVWCPAGPGACWAATTAGFRPIDDAGVLGPNTTLPGGNPVELEGVSDTEAYANLVGGVARFDGTSWSLLSLPSGAGPVTSLAVAGSNAVWITTNASAFGPRLYQWTGSGSFVEVTSPDGGTLPAHAVWARGSQVVTTGQGRFARFDGAGWVRYPAPMLDGGVPEGAAPSDLRLLTGDGVLQLSGTTWIDVSPRWGSPLRRLSWSGGAFWIGGPHAQVIRSQ